MGQLRSKSTSRPIKPLLARWDMCGIARSLRLAAYPTHRRTHLIIFAACARSGQHKTSSTLACRSYTPIDPESVCCNEWCYRTGTYDTYLAACFFFDAIHLRAIFDNLATRLLAAHQSRFFRPHDRMCTAHSLDRSQPRDALSARSARPKMRTLNRQKALRK